MLSLGLIGVLFGMLLGSRYRVLVLAPAFLIGCVLVFANGLFIGATGGVILLAALTVVITLQVGYLCGIFLRLLPGEILSSERRKPAYLSRPPAIGPR